MNFCNYDNLSVQCLLPPLEHRFLPTAKKIALNNKEFKFLSIFPVTKYAIAETLLLQSKFSGTGSSGSSLFLYSAQSVKRLTKPMHLVLVCVLRGTNTTSQIVSLI